MSSTENIQILQREDAIVLRPQPVVRKARSQELRTIVNYGPLTITEVKTTKGEIAYIMKARRNYIKRKGLLKIMRTIMQTIYPEMKAKHNERMRPVSRKYYTTHREEVLVKSRERYAEHKEEINAKRRERYALAKQLR